MEVVLYEFGFDYVKVLGFLPILMVGLAFFFAEKLIGNAHTSSTISTNLSTKEISPKIFKMTTRCIGGFCAVVFLIFFALHISEYNAHKDMLETGSVSTVQGYVENYSPLPSDGKGTENFEINGVYFAYNDADGTNGYKKTADRGGVITHNGQHLIIKYVTNEDGENIILYIAEIE